MKACSWEDEKHISTTDVVRCLILAPFFFPKLFFYVYIESPNPKEPGRPHTTGPKPNQLNTPTPKTQSKTPYIKPEALNHKMRKKKKKLQRVNLGNKYSLILSLHSSLFRATFPMFHFFTFKWSSVYLHTCHTLHGYTP